MTSTKKNTDYNRQHAKDERAYGARNEDPYQSRAKYSEPCVCSGCGAVLHKGRWQWGIASPDAHTHLCPACHRIHDRVPAGIVNIRGEFFAQHRQEILSLIHNLEAREKAEHPLQRIMSIHANDGGVEVQLTDFHLTHAIGEALAHAYQGELQAPYPDKDGVMHVNWSR